jgi:hypothetical protein
LETAVVQKVQVHGQQPYRINTVVMTTTGLYALLDGSPAVGFALQATPNHPVWTSAGPRPLGQLEAGQIVKCLEAGSGTFSTYQVAAVNPGTNASFYTDKVYNLVTDKPNYVVNRTVVMGK